MLSSRFMATRLCMLISGCVFTPLLFAAAPYVDSPALDGEASVLLEVAVPGADNVGAAAVRAWRDWLIAQGFAVDRCGHNPKAGTLIVDISNRDQRQKLLDTGFRIINELGSPHQEGILTQSQYFDPTEIASMLAQVEIDHPGIARRFSIGTTTQGRDIWAIEISNHPDTNEDEPAIQFNGQHHAREVVTSHVVMDIVESLTNGYGSDSQITEWVNNYTTICVPMVNPDGVQHVFNGTSLWRKNRMTYSCIGVDLNRNYPYLWGPGCGSSSTCTMDTYRGPAAASELETLAMIGLQDQYHFVMATSYHSSGQFIDYPYACSNGSPSGQMPEHAVIHEMMHGVSDGIFAMDGTRYDVYSPVPFGGVNGDDTSWYYAHRGVYAFIIEVGLSFEPDFSLVAGIVNQNRGGWRYMYQRLGQARIDVHVRDACTKEPLEAVVTLKDYVYDTGETPRVTPMPYGRWTYVVPANGTYTVRASMSGYLTQDVPAVVSNAPAALEILLEPVDPPPGGCTSGDVPAASTYGMIALALAVLCAGTIIRGRLAP